MRTFGYLFFASMLMLACGDDSDPVADTGTADTGTADTSTADTGTADTGTADTGTADTGTADTGADDTGTADTSTADTSTADTGEGSAAAFCTTYETTCTFTGEMRFADRPACIAFYEGGAASCQTCITTHLGLAAEDAATHCPHTMGLGPCAGDCE